ncbi:Uncharacterised protein [Edwardsiella hoshinae]|uniref:Formamidopyrimidine-DNA glycosylase n=1 Tax=Edwardsiella hoshinae TaxID=93378 RepID=A0A376D9X2_9GAMM|nr:formamidopyrimidine-DNA glycosylase [Edwardsiella hoshinae]STC85541.1 Uncharacterised protein [Edwardsiella hoshinae]
MLHRKLPARVDQAREETGTEARENAVQGLLALRYAACARCGRRIRVRLHSVLSRCHTWCPYCRENVPLCRPSLAE